ncbi:baseplate J/gp47 family protein [Fluviispira vulneris]|uniref:baseplate J/gp47 family protein n=1 Tax=Fluviispira vulneris TaxID=2763012 RepID=UPI0016476380|nr:baseplate J/gp47 family protein [Fluviispira vulneris]
MKKYGITNEGFVSKDFNTCREEIVESFKNKINQNIDDSPTSVIGNITTITAEKQSLLWDALQEVFVSFFPNTSTGIPFQNSISLNGIKMLSATASRVLLTFKGKAGTKIPAQTCVGIVGTSYQFATKENAIIGDNGEVETEAECTTLGNIKALSGTINKILNPIYGIDSCTNKLDAIAGQDEETESDTRIRRLQLLQRAGSATTKGIVGAIKKNLGVTAVILLNPDDSNLIPNGHIQIFVEGGKPEEIAYAIVNSRGGGIKTFSEKETGIFLKVRDSEGIMREVSFSRPREKLIYLEISIQTTSEFPADGHELIKKSLLEYANKNLGIGKSVINSSLYVPINSVAGIVGIKINQGTNPNPTSSANIQIQPIEYAKFDSTRITFKAWD